MNKKIIGTLLGLSLLTSALPVVTGFAEMPDVSAREFVQRMDIMSGYGNGSFGDSDTLTRAQLVKIVIKITDRDFIPVNNVSPYSDVPYTSWAASYINRASELGYFSGFPDGSFHPEDTVTAEQVCKIMLKILGYETDYTAGNWAYEQIRLAGEKGLLDGVQYAQNEPLSRINTAKVIKNTLLSKPKNSQSYYIENMGFRYMENIIPTSEKNVPTGYVATSAGNLKKGSLQSSQLLKRGDAVVDKDNQIIVFAEKPNTSREYIICDVLPDRLSVKSGDEQTQLILESGTVVYNSGMQVSYANAFSGLKNGDKIKVFYRDDGAVDYLSVTEDTSAGDTADYIIKTVLSDGIVAFGDTVDKTLKFDDDTLVYDGSISSTYASAAAKFALGDKLTIYYDGLNGVKYLKYQKDALKGPVTNVSGNALSSLGATDNAKIMRDGMPASAAELMKNDVCYYVEQTDTVLAYSKKITGVYEDALPNKDGVRQAIVSGKTYNVGTSTAFSKLSSNKIEFGDSVTLLFGKDGSVADVVTSENEGPVIAYILSSGRKETTNPNTEKGRSYYIQALLTDGQTAEYITDKDYDDFCGRLVNISFANGKASVKALSGKSDASGRFDWNAKTFGNDTLARDLVITDVSTFDKGTTGAGGRVYPQRLDGLTLASSNVLYTQKNSKGEIDRIVLNDYTHDIYEFGIVLKANVVSSVYATAGSYELLINGESRNIMTSGSAFSAKNRQPSYFKYNGQSLKAIMPLTEIRGAVSSITSDTAYIGGEKYPVSDSVQVYKNVSGTLSGRDFELIPLSDIPKNASMTAYIDKTPSLGGRVRVLIVD
jgi:hypothetical protein